MTHDANAADDGFVIEIGGHFTDPDTGQTEYATIPVERYDTLDEAIDAAQEFCDAVLDHLSTIFPVPVPPIDIRIIGPDGVVYERPWTKGGGGSSGGSGGGSSGSGTGGGKPPKKPRPPVGPNKRTWF